MLSTFVRNVTNSTVIVKDGHIHQINLSDMQQMSAHRMGKPSQTNVMLSQSIKWFGAVDSYALPVESVDVLLVGGIVCITVDKLAMSCLLVVQMHVGF